MENQKVVSKNVAVEEKNVAVKERETGRKPLPILHTRDWQKAAQYMMLNGVR